MIQPRTTLKVADNSGAKTVKCIKVLGGFRRKYAFAGDTIVVSVQNIRNRFKETSKVKKREVYRGLVIRTRRWFKQKNGENTRLNENKVVLMNKQNLPVGTRVTETVARMFKKKKFQKFFSVSLGLF